MCVCVFFLLLFPPPPTRSLELFNHVFFSRFHCQRKQTWSHHFSSFCWSTQCSSIESYSDVKIVQLFFLIPFLPNMCFPSCPPHFPCMFHHFTILNSIDFPLMFHDFSTISPSFPLHFPYFPLMFHDFTFISPAFSIFPWLFGLWFLVHVGQGQGGVRLRGLQPRPGLRPTGPGGHGALLPMDGSPGALDGRIGINWDRT